MAKTARKKRRTRTPVGSPLEPANLHAMGALKQLPKPPAGFDPSGGWTQTWRIWTCYGYREGSNANAGFLRIERVGRTDPFTLKVAQELRTPDSVVHRLDASIQCTHDRFATPVSWTLSSGFRGGGGRKPPAGVATREAAAVQGKTLAVTTGERKLTRRLPGRWTSDWSLFEALQRRPFRSGEALKFDVLEGLSLLKRGHVLRYKGRRQVTLGDAASTLHLFHQVGRGVLPYEWWLDEAHRLVLVVTGYRTYILEGRP